MSMSMQAELVTRSLKRMTLARLYASWNIWRDLTEAVLHQQRSVRSALVRMKLRMVSAAWSTWRQTCVQLRKAQEHETLVLTRAVSRWNNQALLAAFTPWVVVTSQSLHTQLRFKKCCMKMIRRSVSTACRRWLQEATSMKTQKMRAGGFMARMKTQHLAAAWNTWREKAMQSALQERLIKKMLLKLDISILKL